jgi:glycosyltransferase involved in cell wall biosynthesis
MITIVGSGNDENIIREKIAREGIEADIKNRVPNHSMPTLYQQCSVYVICSRYEGNPKTLLEAMSCGCAVIGTNVKGVRGIIEHGKNGILVDQDATVLRQAMLDLINNRDLCLELGKAARKGVLQKHSLDVAVEAEWRAYNALTKLGQG